MEKASLSQTPAAGPTVLRGRYPVHKMAVKATYHYGYRPRREISEPYVPTGSISKLPNYALDHSLSCASKIGCFGAPVARNLTTLMRDFKRFQDKMLMKRQLTLAS